MEKLTYDLDSIVDISHQESLKPITLILTNDFTRKWSNSVKEYAEKTIKPSDKEQIYDYYDELLETFLKDANNKHVLHIRSLDKSLDSYTIHNDKIHKSSKKKTVKLLTTRNEDYIDSILEQISTNNMEMFSEETNFSEEEETEAYLKMQLLFLTLSTSVLFEDRNKAVIAQNALNGIYNKWLEFEVMTLKEHFNTLRENIVQLKK